MQKKYVSVNAEVDTDGVLRPLLIRWRSTSRRKWGWDRTVAQDEKIKRSP